MPDTHILLFEPFRADLRDERLWRGEDVIHLTHKAFAALSVCIRELRGRLGTMHEGPRASRRCGGGGIGSWRR